MIDEEVRKATSALRAARLLLQEGFTDEAVSSTVTMPCSIWREPC